MFIAHAAVVTFSDIVLYAHVVNAKSRKVYSLKIWQLSHHNTFWEKKGKMLSNNVEIY